MKFLTNAASGFVALSLLLLIGCATTTVIGRQPYTGERLARPSHIIIYDFAASPADIPAGSQRAGQYYQLGTVQSGEEIELGRKLGGEVAKELVANIQGMGLPAVRATDQPIHEIGDLVIMGYFESMDTGSAMKRLVIGFGSGAADLKTEVEGYLVTNQGLRLLGSGELNSGGGKMPGTALPLAVLVASGNPIGLIVGGVVKVGGEVTGKSTVEGSAKRTADKIAKQLKVKFEEQGWI